MQFGIEIDVAAFEEEVGAGGVGGTAWEPPPPSRTVALPLLTDLVEVAVYRDEGGPVLAGAMELVSPANKDRPTHREAFAAKCRSYLQEGIGLVVVDVVTDRRADLHAPAAGVARRPRACTPRRRVDLWAASYRPIGRDDQGRLDLWHRPIALGEPLPTMPLWLRGGPCLPVELDASYERTCREQRIPDRPS